jgi:hypothetical protein
MASAPVRRDEYYRSDIVHSLGGDFTSYARPKIVTEIGAHPPLLLLLVATMPEVSGDAVVRMAIYHHIGLTRLALFTAGAALLLGYGSFLDLAPIEFGRVAGLYIATLYCGLAGDQLRRLPSITDNADPSRRQAGGAIIAVWNPA